ncbi:uncharacterized protein LOC111873371 isoform X1 [Cryptotermes secundus]|nr:uncharacterized protein LOC111873371 isoform X1 [Cryptotermes secundus]
MKKWFRHLQPVQLYLMLGLTTLFFLVQLFMSHMTHALTLLVDSYHMLCNVMALVGCIITIKYGSANVEREEEQSSKESENRDVLPSITIPLASPCHNHNATAGCAQHHQRHQHHHHNHVSSSEEKKLKNTFGWARIDVLVMLSGFVFLASLCFSLVVEALQTLVHIDHQDEMHHPIPVMCVGATGLLLNGLCYLLIGGYTLNQGSFLHVTPSGDVILDRSVNKDSVRKGQRRLSAETNNTATSPQVLQRQGLREMCRDVLGCLIVILCALIVYFTEENFAKYVDPALSILSAVLLLILSYPYMKESSSILLQTIPDTINIDSLRSELLKAFPDIVNVHDLHIWRLTATKVFSTAHIIFLNSRDYLRITKDVTEFFHDQGITQVTIQPEFFKMDNKTNLMQLPKFHEYRCLVQCQELGCYSLHCCTHNDQDLMAVAVDNDNNHHQANGHSRQCLKNHKKDVAAGVQQLSHRKSSIQSDPALASKINQSLETASGNKDSNTCICEEGLRDACSVHSDLEQEVGENYAKINDEHITIRYSAHPNTEKAATIDSTHLNTTQEIVMNGMHNNLDHETVLNDLHKNADKVTEISTLSHSDLMKQELVVQRNVVQFPTVDSKSAAVGPQDLRIIEHDTVILETASRSSPEKSDTVSLQSDISHAEFPVSGSASTDLVVTKSNVQNVTKLEMGELQSKTEIGK